MTDQPEPPHGEDAPSPVLGPPIPPPRQSAPSDAIPPEWFFPDEGPADALPRRPLLRRALIALYILIVLCVIIALLAMAIPWGDLDLPFDPPFRYQEYL